tara:strand:+ start:1698 stop:1895 length:198 start_codon:yes stop_codon:yes gene_type:complete
VQFISEFGCTAFVAEVKRTACYWHAVEPGMMLEFAVIFFLPRASSNGRKGSAYQFLFFFCKGIFL